MPQYPGRKAEIIDSENSLKLQHLMAIASGNSIYILGTQKGTYTVNDGTWNIDYTWTVDLVLANIPFNIVNQTTGKIYSTTGATVTSTQLQLASAENTGMTPPATGDILFIPIISTERSYYTNDMTKVLEQSPLKAQVIDEKLLNAVTATGRSTFTEALSYKGLTFCIVASSVTDGATFIFEGSPDATVANTQGLQAKNSSTGAVGNSFNITADGTYYFQIDDTITPKYLDINLSVRIDGTYTAYLAGRAL